MAKKKRRAFNPLSLAFLDVMSCGFGAVVLLFLILDHASNVEALEGLPGITEEIILLEEEITEGVDGLAAIRNTLADISLEVVTAQGLVDRVQVQIDDFMQQLAALENDSLAQVDSEEQLRADIQALEDELRRLQASAMEQEGNSVRQHLGDGDRQYLSGLYLGGNRILILIDTSSSMLDETLVNVLRMRNMNVEAKRRAPKWQRAVRTVDWISSQLPVTSRYQIYTYADQLAPAVDGTAGTWLEVADQQQLDSAIERIREIIPEHGTNMQRLFEAIQEMSPPPDNIFLITDGLPTLNNRSDPNNLVTPSRRLELFYDATEDVARNVPINIVLLPLEGDPMAAAAYWELAQYTRGSFLTPARDWP